MRELLSEDGAIFVSIDDNEVQHLRMLMDELFGEEKFIGEIVWRTRNTDNRVTTNLSIDHEAVLVYGGAENPSIAGRKIDRSDFQNPDNDPRGAWVTRSAHREGYWTRKTDLHYVIEGPKSGDRWEPDPSRGWITDEGGFKKLLADGKIWWPPDSKTGKPRKKGSLSETSERMPASSFWSDLKGQSGADELDQILSSRKFAFPKAVDFLKRVLRHMRLTRIHWCSIASQEAGRPRTLF